MNYATLSSHYSGLCYQHFASGMNQILLGRPQDFDLYDYDLGVYWYPVKVVNLDQRIETVEELDPRQILCCVQDYNSNQCALNLLMRSPRRNQFIILTIFDHVVTLSSHPYGCQIMSSFKIKNSSWIFCSFVYFRKAPEYCRDPKTESMLVYRILDCGVELILHWIHKFKSFGYSHKRIASQHSLIKDLTQYGCFKLLPCQDFDPWETDNSLD
ncbi:pumilio 3 [Artemisia annua]|uniref:Pumilio 3 n=1 Tax=Artemisia annua TaxID=35608 RepID=A0A2U1MJG3_ARTAN|nr:pumilio 3 [Artemisia annua]